MLSHSCKDAFWKAFRKKAHYLLQQGYESALPEIRKHDPEENISGIIEDHIGRILFDGLCFEPEFSLIRTGNEKLVNDGTRYGKNRLKIDIIVLEPQRGGPEAVFAFEAKRLRTGGHPIGQYTGAGGMQCFLNDDYVPDMPEAGMIGYVQNKDICYWKKQLQDKLKEPLKRVKVIETLPHEWKTAHERKSGTSLYIYHLFLECHPDEGRS